MSEFEQGGYQTTTEPVTQEPSIQQESVTQEPVTTQEPNYFEIKYNKEPVKVSYEEAPTYIQKGMNYDKVHQQVETYQQQLNRVAQIAGYQSHDEMLSALDELEQQQQREQYEQAGINPDVLNQFIEQHPSVKYANELKAKEQEQAKFNNEANELFAEFPDLKPEQIPAEVWQLKESKGLSLLDSYLRVSYKSLGQQKEQEAIQKLQQNAQSSPGSLGAGADHQPVSVKNMSKDDFESLIQRVKRGERVEL
jgi:hypothetical protein